MVEKIGLGKISLSCGLPRFGESLFPQQAEERFSIQKFFSVATCGDGNQESKEVTNLQFPCWSSALKVMDKKVQNSAAGLKSELSPNLDRVNLLIFKRLNNRGEQITHPIPSWIPTEIITVCYCVSFLGISINNEPGQNWPGCVLLKRE